MSDSMLLERDEHGRWEQDNFFERRFVRTINVKIECRTITYAGLQDAIVSFLSEHQVSKQFEEWAENVLNKQYRVACNMHWQYDPEEPYYHTKSVYRAEHVATGTGVWIKSQRDVYVEPSKDTDNNVPVMKIGQYLKDE